MNVDIYKSSHLVNTHKWKQTYLDKYIWRNAI